MTHSCIQGPPANEVSHVYGPTVHDHLRLSVGQHERSPHYVEPPKANVEPVFKILAWYGVAAAICLFVMWLLTPRNVWGAERDRFYVIWNVTTNEQAHPHKFTSAGACNTDIGGYIKSLPDGSRVTCVDLRTKEGR